MERGERGKREGKGIAHSLGKKLKEVRVMVASQQGGDGREVLGGTGRERYPWGWVGENLPFSKMFMKKIRELREGTLLPNQRAVRPMKKILRIRP